MIVLDTSSLIESLCGMQTKAGRLRSFFVAGEIVRIPAIVLYEWLRGPRLQEELLAQEQLFPRDQCLPFGASEAAIAAKLYQNLRVARGREVDLAIAATAIHRELQED